MDTVCCSARPLRGSARPLRGFARPLRGFGCPGHGLQEAGYGQPASLHMRGLGRTSSEPVEKIQELNFSSTSTLYLRKPLAIPGVHVPARQVHQIRPLPHESSLPHSPRAQQ